ncbi:MAG: restriction endonuclease subunit S [Candidatus Margulisiibacteriota bacterium]
MKNKVYQLSDIADISTGYHFRKGIENDAASLHYILQAKNINHNYKIDYQTLEKTSFSTNNHNKYLLQKNDIIMLSKGVNYYSSYVDKNIKNLIPTSNLLVLRPKREIVLTEYIWWYLNHPDTQNTLKQLSQGIAIRHISKSKLEELSIPVPDLKTQKLIIRIYKLKTREKELFEKIHQKKEQLFNKVLLGKARKG